MSDRLERLCQERGLRVNSTRRFVLAVLDEAQDHPCADDVYHRIIARDGKVSLPTNYRTLNTLVELSVLVRLDLGDGKARFEQLNDDHHDHSIDVQNGDVVEFYDKNIEWHIRAVAKRLGYLVVEYRLELFGKSLTRQMSSSMRQSSRLPLARPLDRKNRVVRSKAKRRLSNRRCFRLDSGEGAS